MSTQLLIYEKAVTVTNQRHRDWSIKKGTDYTFAKHVNAVPLTAVEFSAAAAEYAIVFTGTAEANMPAVILGMRDRQNLYLNEDGTWRAKYLPAFIDAIRSCLRVAMRVSGSRCVWTRPSPGVIKQASESISSMRRELEPNILKEC